MTATLALFAAAFLAGYWFVSSSKSVSGTQLGQGGGGAVASFDPKIAAEILRNTLYYTFAIEQTPEEQALGMHRLKMTRQKGLVSDLSAFQHAATMNSSMAILGPKGMWDYQPWSEQLGQLLFIDASKTDLINSMASKDSPWAVLVRAPGKLTKYEKAAPATVLNDLRASDIA
jgi:hypothetical protein